MAGSVHVFKFEIYGRGYEAIGLPYKKSSTSVFVKLSIKAPILAFLESKTFVVFFFFYFSIDLSSLIGTQQDVDLAVQSARTAYDSWSKLPGHVRARHLYSIARHIQKHARLISVLESMDNGKTIRETRDCDIPLVARHLYHHAGKPGSHT